MGILVGGISSFVDVKVVGDSLEACPGKHMVAFGWCLDADTTGCTSDERQTYTGAPLHLSTSIFPIEASGWQSPDEVHRDGEQTSGTVNN